MPARQLFAPADQYGDAVMKITDVKGLKYPDEYVIKFFFKEGLHKMQ